MASLLASLSGKEAARIVIRFADADTRETVTCRLADGKEEEQYLFHAADNVCGTVELEVNGSRKLEHQGVKVELVGLIEMLHDRSNTFEFTSLVRELEPAGELLGSKQYPFEFTDVDKPHESYDGINVRLRYFVRVTIQRQYSSRVVHEETIRVHVATPEEPDVNNSIKMEVGIEDCLHIEFEYNKSKYHLKDAILGKIFFLLVRIKIKHMEIAIIKRESTGTGSNAYNENETVAKYEIMDGAPVRGESIPIRLFLGGFDTLTPTMRNVNNKFSVKYFLNLVLIDEEDRRYFKQQEIVLFRK
jgi:vacuolar protein sorting-associated protein 26